MLSKFKTLLIAAILLPAMSLCAQTIIIGGATGNGDFELTEPAGLTGAQWYSATPDWVNLGGSEGINFAHDAGLAGHPDNAGAQVNFRGGFLFPTRPAANRTGYTIQAADEVISLIFDISRHGGGWSGTDNEYVKFFLFTASGDVNGDTVVGDISEIASSQYTIVSEPFWQIDITADPMYTTTAQDIGKTVYLGVELITPNGNTVYPRIDNIELVSTPSGPPMWNGYVIEEDGVSVDTGDVLGWVDIRHKPWIWVHKMETYFYIEENLSEDGGWVHVPQIP
ncbi:MAG: hypothetical protein AB3N63_02545 [Puniceicoccaceae bacterium]